MSSIKELKQAIDKLEKENARLQDENSSLWFLLDELEKSDIGNEQYRENFERVFNNLRKNAMMMHQKVEEA
jgi:regulator of replication initiation timing|tara:strand:- start:10901 stop:11113 length:213 start_codon:yes stop_codon:yes gene_type:complete